MKYILNILCILCILILCIIIYYKFIRNIDGFADKHPSSNTEENEIDCSNKPRSISSNSTNIGCAGAVYGDGVTHSEKYCNGDGHKGINNKKQDVYGKYPWFKKCCTWEEEECKPKATATTATATANGTGYKIEVNTDKLSSIIYPFKLTNDDALFTHKPTKLHSYLKALVEETTYKGLFRNFVEINSFITNNPDIDGDILTNLEVEYNQHLLMKQLKEPDWVDDDQINNDILEKYVNNNKVFLYLKLNESGKFKIQMQHSNGSYLGPIPEFEHETFEELESLWNELEDSTVFYNQDEDNDNFGFGFKELYSDQDQQNLTYQTILGEFETQYNYLTNNHGHYHVHTTQSGISNTDPVIWPSNKLAWPHIHLSELTPFYTPFSTVPVTQTTASQTTAAQTTATTA
jgi:hypothetical protein